MITYQFRKIILLSSCILFFLPLITQAQLPEQDCSGAILVTSSLDTFPVSTSYGNIQELTFDQNTSCLTGGEENSIWIYFTVCDTGMLLFEIIPYDPNDDFDWALYDFTNHTCGNVLDSLNEVRCNYSAIPDSTGLRFPYALISVNSGGPNQCAPVHPYANQRFLLLVNNHANSATGFVLWISGTAPLCSTAVAAEKLNDNPFLLYPNPTNGILQLKNLPAKNDLSIEVINVYGNKVYGTELKGTGDNQLHLLSTLPDGFYALRILTDGKLFRQESFIISR